MAEDGSAEVAAEGDAPRPEIQRALEPGACAHLRPLIEHHRAVAHVEDDPRLHLRPHDDHFGGIAEHDAPVRNVIPALGEEVGTVRRQQVLQGGEEIIGPVQHEPVDLRGLAGFVRLVPFLAGLDDPRHGGAFMDQPPDTGRDFEGRARRREPARRHDGGAADRVGRLHGGLGPLVEFDHVRSENRRGVPLQHRLPPLTDEPEPRPQLGNRPGAGEWSPAQARICGFEQVQRRFRHRGPAGAGNREPA